MFENAQIIYNSIKIRLGYIIHINVRPFIFLDMTIIVPFYLL